MKLDVVTYASAANYAHSYKEGLHSPVLQTSTTNQANKDKPPSFVSISPERRFKRKSGGVSHDLLR